MAEQISVKAKSIQTSDKSSSRAKPPVEENQTQGETTAETNFKQEKQENPMGTKLSTGGSPDKNIELINNETNSAGTAEMEGDRNQNDGKKEVPDVDSKAKENGEVEYVPRYLNHQKNSSTHRDNARENFRMDNERFINDSEPDGNNNTDLGPVHNSATSSRTSTSTELSEQNQGGNVKVVVRIRPFNDAEKENAEKEALELCSKRQLSVKYGSTSTKQFTFHNIFTKSSTQEEVFEHSGISDLINFAVNGFSCTVFAFGQTGSGKTHTITGPVGPGNESRLSEPESHGLLPRSFYYLFNELENRDIDFTLRASYLEVYNEKVKDLLNPSHASRSLNVRWSRESGFFVENLFLAECYSPEDLMVLLEEGLQNRQVGSHAFNDHSSRSHCMLTIHIDTEETNSKKIIDFPVVKHGKISFVDLAGSERVKETKSTADAFTESQNINKSLLTLGNCISSLGDPKRRSGHIPYRDSKLTKLLADSLGGDGFTLMIACVSPSLAVVQDTINTLRYANRARNIKNKPVVKMDPREQLIMRLKQDLKMMKNENDYFRELLDVPNSESQIVLQPSHFTGVISPNLPTSTNDSSALPKSSLSSTFSESSSTIECKLAIDEHGNKRASTAGAAEGATARLYQMLQEYMVENENLRSENLELHLSRSTVQKERQLLSRDNEKLIKKMEDLERVMSSSPAPSGKGKSNSPKVPSSTKARVYRKGKSDSDLSQAMKSDKKDSTLPYLRKGSYPNYVAGTDLVSDFEMEKKKLQVKKDNADKRKEREKEQPQDSKKREQVIPHDDLVPIRASKEEGPVFVRKPRKRLLATMKAAKLNESKSSFSHGSYAARFKVKRSYERSNEDLAKTNSSSAKTSITDKAACANEDLPPHDSASGYDKLNSVLEKDLDNLNSTIKKEFKIQQKHARAMTE